MSSRVVVALRIRARPERVFAAFVGEIGLWWRPSRLFAFTPGAPGVLRFEGDPPRTLSEISPDGARFEIGPVLAYEPPDRIRFGWRQAAFSPGEALYVEARFEALGEETRVTVEQGGFDGLAAESRGRHGAPDLLLTRRAGEMWERGLRSLSARLAGPVL